MNPPRLLPSALGDLTNPGSLTRVLLDRMTEGVSLSREDGTIVYTNPAEDDLFGYEAGELWGQHVTVQNAYTPEENERIVTKVIDELKRSGSWQGEWHNRRKDHTLFTTRSRISAVEIDGQSYWLCVQEDATEETAAAQALQEERTRLKLATDSAEIGIWDWDARSRQLTYSERAKRLYGIPVDQEVTSELVFGRIHPEDRDRIWSVSRVAMSEESHARDSYEYRLLLPDGTVRWVQASGEAIFEPTASGPAVVRYVGTIQDISTRRKLEEAERERAQHLRLAIEAGRMVVWDLDVIHDSVTHSPELNRILGFPENEVLDLNAVRARYAPGEQERLQTENRAAMERGETSFENSFRYMHPEGSHRWLRLRCDVLFDAEGRPVRALGVLSDETEPRKAEEDLRASEARLQLASKAARAGVWEWDLVADVTVWSPEEYVLFGIDPVTTPPSDVVAAWKALIHPDDLATVMDQTELVRREGGTHDLDYRVIVAGETRWMRSHQTAVAGPEGMITRLVGIEIDVTEEYRKAEALRSHAEALEGEVEERRRELDRFFALSNDLFAVGGFDGFLTSVNPAWSRLLGVPDEEILSRPFVEFVHPDDHGTLVDAVQQLRAGDLVQKYLNRMICRDGRVVWLSWTGVAEGEQFYVVGRDITQEREREEILRQSQKMEALGQLTGGIAHDFNNLLQAVQGSLALIRKRSDNPERVCLLAEQGMEAARRGGSLTAQLLAFARSQQLAVKPVQVAQALEGLQDLLQRTLGPMSLVRIETPDRNLAALADPTQLEMAILNLAINARDAMPEGGTISISAEAQNKDDDPELPPGDYVLICVRDTGTGMTPEVAQRAFEPFFTTKGLGRGTGLGLSQVYAMARQSGGTVRLNTHPGQGTAVCVFLRQAERALEGERTTGMAKREQDGTTGATILVIDDDDLVRRSLVAEIEALGHRVLEASSGSEGLSVLDQEPDVIVVDFAMPGMNGAEVAEAVRRTRPDLPIIFVTGYGDTAAIAQAMGESSLVLRKPFEFEELEAALSRQLRARDPLASS
nr:PAS domain-containing protein [Rubellimicrobium rubrum]